MLRPLKMILWIGLMAFGLQSAGAFSIIGANANGGIGGDAWQTPVIGYGIGADMGTPKNLGEEYRWNVPVFYYSVNQQFYDYFGSNGIVEVDKAFAILNDAFTNNLTGGTDGVDSYSADLSEFPLDSKQLNYDARALYLCDLKSVVLQTMVAYIGLAEPERYTWTLRQRTVGNPCPTANSYLVVKRNFDPVTFEPTSYVNGNLYTYVIIENCTGGNPLAYTSIFVVDPVPEFGFTSLAGFSLFTPSSPPPVGYGGGIDIGAFYTSLTRDEAGGLRYLYRKNNMNFENVGPGATLFTQTTNTAGGGQLLTTLDLGPFLNSLATTDPNTLRGQYPNLDITSVVTNYVLITQTNIIIGTNTLPWLPAGFVAIGITQIVPTNFFAQRYTYTFGNIVTNHIYTNWSTVTKSLTIVPQPFAPAGSGLIQTNTQSVTTKGVGGDFYILPPGVSGYVFQPGLVITNKGTTTTTTTLITDSTGAAVTQQQIVTPFTNYSYIVYTIQLQATTNALQMQGIQKMTFIRRDYDSLIGSFFQPISNNYTLTSIESSSLVKHPVQRVVNAPDILITATDHGNNGYVVQRGISFRTNALPGLAGPGTITQAAAIDLNKGAPLFINAASGTEADQTVLMVWGSFDGTTNPPVAYPNWINVANLENQVLMHVTSIVLPAGKNGVAYNGAGFQLTGTGGSPPYTWTIVGNAALPPGLVLSPDGIISGVPTSAATFDFRVRMTDIGARSIDQPLSITINP